MKTSIAGRMPPGKLTYIGAQNRTTVANRRILVMRSEFLQ